MAVSSDVFGEGTGPILASGYNCNGSEFYLTECSNDTVVSDLCTHALDAAVSCQPGSSKMMLVMLQLLQTCML